eukprot:403373233
MPVVQNRRVQYLDVIFKQSVNCDDLDLSATNLSDLNEILPLLVKFPALLSLNLENNQLQELSNSLSPFIRHLKELNINNNPFNDINYVVNQLSALPNLISLYMSLFEEDIVHLVITSLPQLQFLNGIEIHRKEVLKTLEDNNQNALIEDNFGEIGFENKKNFDEFGNGSYSNKNKNLNEDLPLEQIRETDEDEHQSIAPQSNNNMGAILNSGGSGITFGNMRRRSEAMSKASQLCDTQEAFTNVDLEKISEYFELIGNQIQQMQSLHKNEVKQYTHGNINETGQSSLEFDQYLEQITSQLNLILTQPMSDHQKQAQFLQAKSSLIELCLKKLIYFMACSNNPMTQILQGLLSQSTLLVQQLFTIINQNQVINQDDQILQKVQDQDEKVVQDKKLVNEMQIRIKELESENQNLRQLVQLNMQQKQAVNDSQKQNHANTTNILKNVHLSFVQSPKPVNQINDQNTITIGGSAAIGNQPQSSEEFMPTQTINMAQRQNVNDMYSQSFAARKQQINNSKLPQIFINEHFKVSKNQIKIKYDLKCKELQMPIETMEQYLYTYLTKKYGLRNLIVQQAATLVNGVKIYMKSDSDIALFAKCLKNECDQEFKTVQDYVKDQISQALKSVLKEKYSQKAEGEIINAMDQLTSGTFKLEKWMWQKSVQKLYSTEERDKIESKINAMIQQQMLNYQVDENQDTSLNTSSLFSPKKSSLNRSQSANKNARKQQYLLNNSAISNSNQAVDFNKTILLSPSNSKQSQKFCAKINFLEFQNIILETQLKQHEIYLKPFNDIFKFIDQDQDGILTHNEFKSLMLLLEIRNSSNQSCTILNDASVGKLIQQIDPYNHRRLTYGQILYALANSYPQEKMISSSALKYLQEYHLQNTGGGNSNINSMNILQMYLQQFTNKSQQQDMQYNQNEYQENFVENEYDIMKYEDYQLQNLRV